MPWYYLGTLLVIPTLLGIFSYPKFINGHDPSLPIDEQHQTKRQAWYITLPAIHSVGWASVQIANMSLIN